MGDISEHFLRAEYECKCGCGFDTVDIMLNKVFEMVRKHFNAVVTVLSGCRCILHNETVQKQVNKNYVPYSSDSWHMKARAGDIRVQGVSPKEVYNFLNERFPQSCGIGLYHNRVHFDSRPIKARWDKTK